MGALYVQIDDMHEVRVKDNVFAPDGWHLWVSLWMDGEWVRGAPGPVVADIDVATLEAAARQWYGTLR